MRAYEPTKYRKMPIINEAYQKKWNQSISVGSF
jgi:hypothetical protein